MELYKVYIEEKEKMISYIKEDISECIKTSFLNIDAAVEECKREVAQTLYEMDYLSCVPSDEYYFIERFISSFFNPKKINPDYFEKALKQSYKNVLEYYKTHPHLEDIKIFINQGSKEIVTKIAYYEAYHQPDNVLFESIVTNSKTDDKAKDENKGTTKQHPKLNEMFTDSKRLDKIVEELIKIGFVERQANNQIKWCGKTIALIDGSGMIDDAHGKQLVALSLVIEEMEWYKKPYLCADIHSAYTEFFSYNLDYSNFKPVNRHKIEKLKNYFDFLTH